MRLLEKLDEPYRTMVSIIAATTGLRVGELLALRWRAVCLTMPLWRCGSRSAKGDFSRPNTAGSHDLDWSERIGSAQRAPRARVSPERRRPRVRQSQWRTRVSLNSSGVWTRFCENRALTETCSGVPVQ